MFPQLTILNPTFKISIHDYDVILLVYSVDVRKVRHLNLEPKMKGKVHIDILYQIYFHVTN